MEADNYNHDQEHGYEYDKSRTTPHAHALNLDPDLDHSVQDTISIMSRSMIKSRRL
jgi:hypothetical protein